MEDAAEQVVDRRVRLFLVRGCGRPDYLRQDLR
jgi:hypothetical protein